MNRDEQAMIRDLFARMADLEARGPSRDPNAEHFIATALRDQPGAPYYMAQTIIVQTEALKAAEERIRALEAEARGRSSRGEEEEEDRGRTILPPGSDDRWDDNLARRHMRGRSVPSIGGRRGESGGFLAGAAQTALGVAGGMFLGSLIGGLFGASPAEASNEEGGAGGESPPEADDNDFGGDAGGDGGGDGGGFGDAGGFDGGGDF